MARVMVNRIWQHLFGKGIVTTSENFGVSGAPPTHPELLEWLAAEWIEGDWRTKPLIRRIMTSRAYRQSSIRGAGTASKDNSAADSVDPDNSLYWRMPLRRLEAEAIRDSILTASGKLDASLGGPPIPLEVRPDGKVVTKTKDDAKTRRSIYVLARRNYHLSLLDTFDQPIVATNCTRRPSSAVVSQPLTMLNDDYIVKQAGFFADRVFQAADAPQQRIAWTFQAALTRQPTAKEFQWCVEFLEKHTKRYQNEGKDRQQSERLAMKHLCHMLFNTSEFLYVP